MKNIPLSILPKVSSADPLYGVLETLRAMAEELEKLGGLRPNAADRAAVTRKELLDLGILGADGAGRLYNPAKRVPALNRDATFASGRKGQVVFWDMSGSKTVGTHEMTGSALPENAVIIWAMVRVLTALESSTDTAVVGLGIHTDDPAGIRAPIAIDDPSAPWAEGVHSAIPNRRDPANDTATTTATGRKAVLTVSGEGLTAGSVVVIAEYVMV